MRKKDLVYLGLILLLMGVSAYGYAITAKSIDVNIDSNAMEKRQIVDATAYVQVLADEDSREVMEKDMTATQTKIISGLYKIKREGTVDDMNKAYDCILHLIPTTTTLAEKPLPEETTTTLGEVLLGE